MTETRLQFADITNLYAVGPCREQAVEAADFHSLEMRSVKSNTEPAIMLRTLLARHIAETELLQALLCSSNLPVLHFCSGMRLRFFSDAAAQAFGFRANNLSIKVEGIWATAPWKDMESVSKTGKPCIRMAAGPDGAIWKCHILPHHPQEGASPGVMVILSAKFNSIQADQLQAPEKGSLTQRQRQIMGLVLAGHPSKNIAADLKISQRTVENHRAAIMRRTGATSLPALARMAVGAARNADHRGENSLRA